MTETRQSYASPYKKLFDKHPWLAHFLVNVVKRILNIIVDWIDKEAKPHSKR